MTREEKIKEILNKHFGYKVKEGSDEWYTLNYQNRFRDLDEMADWCDKNPREGLWDSEKVIEWIKNNAGSYLEDNHKFGEGSEYCTTELLDDLRKAMEE